MNPYDVINTIELDTRNRKKNKNIFASIHSAPITFYTDLWKGKNKKFDTKDLVNVFTAVVPENTIVFTFTPSDNFAWSTQCQEKNELMNNLRYPDWLDWHEWPLTRTAMVYFPGDKMYNQACEFDHGENNYFDIYSLYGNPINRKKIRKGLGLYNISSSFKKQHIRKKVTKTPRKQTRNNKIKFFYNREIIKDVFTTQDLINEFKSDPPKDGSKPYRIIYIYSCNPPINDYDVKDITKNEFEQNEIIAMNYHIRKTYEREGRDRFVKNFLRGIDFKNTRFRKTQSLKYYDIDKDEDDREYMLKSMNRNVKHIADYDLQLINGITNSGKLCKKKCVDGLCVNEDGETEWCFFPDSQKTGKKSRKKNHKGGYLDDGFESQFMVLLKDISDDKTEKQIREALIENIKEFIIYDIKNKGKLITGNVKTFTIKESHKTEKWKQEHKTILSKLKSFGSGSTPSTQIYAQWWTYVLKKCKKGIRKRIPFYGYRIQPGQQCEAWDNNGKKLFNMLDKEYIQGTPNIPWDSKKTKEFVKGKDSIVHKAKKLAFKEISDNPDIIKPDKTIGGKKSRKKRKKRRRKNKKRKTRKINK